MTYQARIVDHELQSRLGAVGAVVVEGPKACGKTETARQIAASEVLLDVDQNARAAVAVNPRLVLEGPAPRLIDEWQIEPAVWDHVRRAVDEANEPGRFILAGSASPSDDATSHTGAGRFARLRMRPMSLFETGHSDGSISLTDLLAGDQAASPDPGLTVTQLAEEISRGGWPGFRRLDLPQTLQAVRDYLDQIRRTDIRQVDGARRDPEKLGQLLRSLARHVATHAAATTLAADTGGVEGSLLDDTVREYLGALRRLFIVEDQPAWAPHLRSKYRLQRAAKRHFVDPSLAVAALRAGPEPLLRDLNLLGLLFESLVVRDLRIYAQGVDAEILQYRDNAGHEADAIVSGPDGRWAAFEIKLGGEAPIDDGAQALGRFLKQIDTTKSGEPAALGVIVGTGYGYVRPDGIQVIPIGCLGP